ncbi:MAG: polyphosphate kinase 1 [Deltaproteobacteria bacterium]|nr:polyphosphate kinase 1 [Deltaproteobacteria bacterium]MCB9787236.1 polyphosphate kinase 1 [Deltaproteobacteria bacterium]
MPDLNDPRLYIHPEQSRLAFNMRVLALAADTGVPLLERLRFLTIASTNLDELFEIRFAGLIEQSHYGVPTAGPDGMTPGEVLSALADDARAMVDQQYAILRDELLPALEAQGIRIPRRSAWSKPQRQWIHKTFVEQVMPVLTPTALDPSHPFPPIQNKSLNFIVSLKGKDAFGRRIGLAVVKAPRCLPRLIRLPTELSSGRDEFVLLSSVIHAHVDELFPGMQVTGCHQFRVTRNSDLWIDEEGAEDLLLALRGQLRAREWGDAVRLEVADTCDAEICSFLLQQFGLERRDLYQVDGPVNLYRLRELCTRVDRPGLTYPPFVPGLPVRLRQGEDLFSVLRSRDVLLHHPYQSYVPVIDLIRQAARDPDVLAIKQTVYRTGVDSEIAEALIEAARRGKEVTAVIELRARFDEAANIDVAQRLRDAGAQVVYGIVGYKAHAKMMLIVRREDDQLRRYAHLGTGNYHASNARSYTDFSTMTSDPELCADVANIFQQLTGLGSVVRHHKLLQSPFTLHETMLRLIDQEAAHARAGKRALIMAKLNNLSEPQIIRALYAASQAGVEIRLVVRGICCLRPGIPGVSDNIRVRSIVGRFLEHARCYYFHADGEEITYLSSADWMPRNVFRRVEVAWPIAQRGGRRRVIRELLTLPFEPDVDAWDLAADGTYTRYRASGAETRSIQRELVAELSALDTLDT